MDSRDHIEALRWAICLSGVNALDVGLFYQVDRKDDATLALWTSVGVEAVTVAVVLSRDPVRAFPNNQLPSVSELEKWDFVTRPFRELSQVAIELYPAATYPEDALDFASHVRNKILHTGETMRAGLVGDSLRLALQIAEWMTAVDLPGDSLRHQLRFVSAATVGEVPDALRETVLKVAKDNAAHLRETIGAGAWDDEPEPKAIAERELADCEALTGR